ncbi:MAG: hypothetical protein ACKO2G_14155 [Verrucomicrobiales bacterium]
MAVRNFILYSCFALLGSPVGFLQAQTLQAHIPNTLSQFEPSACPQVGPLYPWKLNIKATVFWVGERPTQNNPVPNCKSSWDISWKWNFGGFDDPSGKNRSGFRPSNFVPRLNPFYVALPYNDVAANHRHKPEAPEVIPWYDKAYNGPGKSVCKGRWVAIQLRDRICYARWEDCGPFVTDDWEYVFGKAKPKTKGNGGAGIDLSPSVRDYLGMSSSAIVNWRFVEVNEVPAGPWRRWGENNHFVHTRELEAAEMARRLADLRKSDDPWTRVLPQICR